MNKTLHTGILRNVAEFTSPKGFKNVTITLEVMTKKWIKGGGSKMELSPIEYKVFGKLCGPALELPVGAVVDVEGHVDSRLWKERLFTDLVADDLHVLTTPVGVKVPTQQPSQPTAPSESEDPGDSIPF
jgi:hypothetical protein